VVGFTFLLLLQLVELVELLRFLLILMVTDYYELGIVRHAFLVQIPPPETPNIARRKKEEKNHKKIRQIKQIFI
jgi:hypothetical protein